MIKSYQDFINEEKWSGDVKTKKHPPKGLFAEGSAKEIAEWCISSHKDLKGSISALDFYINRAGNNLSEDRKAVLEKAKAKIEKHFSTNEGVMDDVKANKENIKACAKAIKETPEYKAFKDILYKKAEEFSENQKGDRDDMIDWIVSGVIRELDLID